MKWLLTVITSAALCGCGGGVPDSGKSAYNGSITWNGAPLPSGTITFADPSGDLDAAQIAEGKFTVNLKPGQKALSVTAEKKVGERKEDRIPDPQPIMHQYLPPELNSASKLTHEVKGPDQEIKIELTGTEVPAPMPAAPPPGRE